jgi:hypothetical protein
MLGCFLALGVALILPALRTHHFGQLYRPFEVRHARVSYTFLDFEDGRGDVAIEPVRLNPLANMQVIDDQGGRAAMHTILILAVASRALRPILRRVRLARSRSSPSDPLVA